MKEITLEELLEAGCHFGHQVNRGNPKASDFIFEARNNIHIIDLEKTRDGLLAAGEYLSSLAAKGGQIVVVGTKRQAQSIVKSEVERAWKEGTQGIHYVTTRWIGGTLTNFSEISKNFKRLSELESMINGEKKGDYTKKERLLFDRERIKLLSFYEGIRNLDRIPDALVIIGTHHEKTAVEEAIKSNVLTVGVVDTNADPRIIDYPIPSNDDAVGAIQILTSYLVDAWIEGSKNQKAAGSPEEKESDKKEEKKEKVKEEKKTTLKKEEKQTSEKKEEATKPAKKAEKKEAKKEEKKK